MNKITTAATTAFMVCFIAFSANGGETIEGSIIGYESIEVKDLSEELKDLDIQTVIFPSPNDFRFHHYIYEGPKQLSNALGCLFPKGSHEFFIDQTLVDNAEAEKVINKNENGEEAVEYKYSSQWLVKNNVRDITFTVGATYKNKHLYSMTVGGQEIKCLGITEGAGPFEGIASNKE